MSRSRGWCFTINNYTLDDQANLLWFVDNPECSVIAGYEVGKKGTPHLQGYAYFPNKKTFKYVKKIIGDRANIRKASGSPQQNKVYCTKDGDYIEFGRIIHVSKKDSIADKIRECETIEEFKEKYLNLYIIYGRRIREYYFETAKKHKTYLIEIVKDIKYNELLYDLSRYDDDIADDIEDGKVCILDRDQSITYHRDLYRYSLELKTYKKYGYESILCQPKMIFFYKNRFKCSTDEVLEDLEDLDKILSKYKIYQNGETSENEEIPEEEVREEEEY